MKQVIINKTFFDKKDKQNFTVFLVKKGMTKQEFAKKIGVNNCIVSFLVNGKRAFSDDYKAKFKKGGFNPDKDYTK